MPAALAFRYARALADLAAKPGIDAEAVSRELGAFEQSMRESESLRTALESPAVPPPRKRAIVSRIAGKLALSDLTRRMLQVVVDHRRGGMIGEIREAFEAVMDQRLGLSRADVISARELDAAQRQKLAASLARLTGKQVRASFRTDRSLIGGVVARVGSTVYDGSVSGQLRVLKRRLAGA